MEQQKRKISARKVIQVVLTAVVSIGCVIAISSASNKEITRNLTGLEIHIKNDKYKFVEAAEIKKGILVNNPDAAHMPMNKVNIGAIEQKLKKNPWVANAQVYIDNKRMMHVNVTQRVPVARIFEESGVSYYIDGTMSIIPTSDKYVYYTTVVTGVPSIVNNKISDSANKSLMSQITYLVKRIERDSFWSAQVSQISMSAERTFEIVPVLGNQRILLGDTSRLDEKLDNLFVFYKKVLARVGWDNYEVLDLRYKGQVVASPALEWKKPTGAISDLQWVETIKSKSAYNGNTFTLDSNNNAVMSKAQVVAVAPAQSQTLVVSAAPVKKVIVEKPVAKSVAEPVSKPAVVNTIRKPEPQAKPVVKIGPPAPKETKVAKKSAMKALTKTATKIGPPAPKETKVAKKSAMKALTKTATKIGPPEDKATAKSVKPVKKEKNKKPAAQKQVAKIKTPVKKDKPKTTVSAAKKVTKKPPVKKVDNKAKDNKQKTANKPGDKKNSPKYIYNNNH
jgi:cell division protein FtsQ